VSVVITGSAGFIGRALTACLHAAGHRVVAIDRAADPSGRPTVDGVPVLTADLLDGDPLVETALREADAVVHLAGCSGVRDTTPGIEHRRRRDNVQATRRVAELVPPDVPLLVTSSSSVYGGARFGRASRESDLLHPRGGYARSKVGAEEVCAQRAAAGGHVLVARPFTVVGEGQRPDMALSRWSAAALAGDPLRVFGSLERTRDFTCVREVARGLTSLLDSGATGVVNVGSGAPRTLDEAVRALGAALGLDIAVEVEPAADIEVTDTWADVRRFESLTGFRPRTDLTDVVRRFVAALPRTSSPARADALLTAG
jgi:nucleoside-diphosphate-sugar epimerase